MCFGIIGSGFYLTPPSVQGFKGSRVHAKTIELTTLIFCFSILRRIPEILGPLNPYNFSRTAAARRGNMISW